MCEEYETFHDRTVQSVVVKSTSPTTENGYEKWLQKLYLQHMNNIHMSDEDNKHDTNYINKHKYTNHDTRKLHLWARHVERAVLYTSCMLCHTHLMAQDVLESSFHPHAIHVRFSLTSHSSLSYFDLSFPVFFHLSVLTCTLKPHTDLNNLNSMQHNLRNSAKGSNDAYDVPISLTGYEPNDMVFNELGNSQGSFSYITPSSDLDIDDDTLGKLLDEAHREHADYRSPEGVSVSQSSLSVVFDRTAETCGREKCRSVNWFWCHKKHVQCSQQVFWKHPSWESGR